MHQPSRLHEEMNSNIDEWSGPTGSEGSIERLCSISLRACFLMNPLISAIYQQLLDSLNQSNSISGVKKDNSAITIADGLVQKLLTDVLFSEVAFRDIVGEEGDDDNDAEQSWFEVQGLSVPPILRPLVETTKDDIQKLAQEYLSHNGDTNDIYQHITVFIDPIDGTREFSTGMGHHSSVCIGFANEHGRAVGGVVFRPLTQPKPTWVVGAKNEGYALCDFGEPNSDSQNSGGGLLTTNGSISPFIEALLEELRVPRIKSGGAGNKMMLLLEKSINCNDGDSGSFLYIQDRGVSRWDTCAAEACLDAFGGYLTKLDPYSPNEERYTYLASNTNLDFMKEANLTKYNCRSSIKDLQPNQKVIDVNEVKPYANLCGLVAVGSEWKGKKELHRAIHRAAQKHPPSFD